MTYDYGVKVSDYTLDDPKKILDLLEYAPKYKEFAMRRLCDFVEDNELASIEDLTVNDFVDALADCRTSDSTGLHRILCEVINEAEEIELVAKEGEWNQDDHFLVMEIRAPWNMPEWEKNMSYERMTDIFKKYMGVLFPGFIWIDYCFI